MTDKPPPYANPNPRYPNPPYPNSSYPNPPYSNPPYPNSSYPNPNPAYPAFASYQPERNPHLDSAGPPPPAYVYQDPNVKVVQQPVQPKPAPQPKKKTGLFGSFMNEVDKVGKQLGKELDYASNKLNEAIDKNYSSNLLGLFTNNNVLQLIPRASQKTVQVLLNEQGHMILDGNGPLDPRPYNTWWTVANEGNNQVRLSNNNNYLAIVQGCITIVPMVPGAVQGLESKFQLHQMGSFVTFECLGDRGKYLGFLHTGQPKLPAGLKKEVDTQFSVKLLSTGYPMAVKY